MSSVSSPVAQPLFSPEEPRSFEYRPVPISVPVAVFLALAGLLSFLTPVGVPVAIFGLLLSLWCVLSIGRSRGELGGKRLAWMALVLSTVGAVGGLAVHSVAYANEVPEGYSRLNFTSDISMKGFVYTPRGPSFHPEVAALDGQKVFIKGYMYPAGQMEGLTSFVLCRDSGDCCFGGTPKIEDMILVTMSGAATADFTPGLTSVAGSFGLRPEGGANSSPVFTMQAIKVEPSQTSF